MKISQRATTWLLVIVVALIIGGGFGALYWAAREAAKPAEYTTVCVAGQTRVIESSKTREFQIIWDETCPK